MEKEIKVDHYRYSAVGAYLPLTTIRNLGLKFSFKPTNDVLPHRQVPVYLIINVWGTVHAFSPECNALPLARPLRHVEDIDNLAGQVQLLLSFHLL